MDHEISWSHHPAFGSCHLFTWIHSKNMGSMWCWTWILGFHARFLGKKSNMDLFAGHGWSPYQDHVKTHGWCGPKLQKLGCPAPCPLKRLSWPVWPTVEPSVLPRVEHGNSTKFHEIPMAYDMHWYVMKVFFTSWISWFLRGKAILWAAELDNKTQRPANQGGVLPATRDAAETTVVLVTSSGVWWFLTGKPKVQQIFQGFLANFGWNSETKVRTSAKERGRMSKFKAHWSCLPIDHLVSGLSSFGLCHTRITLHNY